MDQPADLKQLMDAAQKMQTEMSRLRDELGNRTVDAETGGGLVRCVANGRGEVLSIAVEDLIVRVEDKQMLQDLIVGAVNLALARAQELARGELTRLGGSVPFPTGSAET